MWLKLRQIALISDKLNTVEQELVKILGLEVCHRDLALKKYGLENILLPVGNQLLEVVAPLENNTAGGRYLKRRGGDGGYMVITQCDDHPPRLSRAEELGVRRVTYQDNTDYCLMQLHPKDTGGCFFEIDEQRGDNAHADDGPWFPAGEDWQRSRKLDRVSGIIAAEIQCNDPRSVAHRWAEIAETEVRENNSTAWSISLANAALRFVECTDGRPEGLGGIDIAVNDAAAILQDAAAINAKTGDRQIQLCGTRINLI